MPVDKKNKDDNGMTRRAQLVETFLSDSCPVLLSADPKRIMQRPIEGQDWCCRLKPGGRFFFSFSPGFNLQHLSFGDLVFAWPFLSPTCSFLWSAAKGSAKRMSVFLLRLLWLHWPASEKEKRRPANATKEGPRVNTIELRCPVSLPLSLGRRA